MPHARLSLTLAVGLAASGLTVAVSIWALLGGGTVKPPVTLEFERVSTKIRVAPVAEARGAKRSGQRIHHISQLLARLREHGNKTTLANLCLLAETWHSLSEDIRAEVQEQFLAGLEAYAAGLEMAAIQDVLTHIPDAMSEEAALPLQRVLFRQLAVNEPHSAVSLTERLAPGLTREIIRLEVVLAWADADWPVAVTWLAQWPDGTVRDIALKTMGTFLADNDPQKAQAWLAAVDDGPVATVMLNAYYSEWERRAFDAAVTVAKQLPDGPEKESALIRLGYQLGRRDFPLAIAHAEFKPAQDEGLLVPLVNQWVQRDPRAAADWAVAQADGKRRHYVISSMVASWAEYNPRAAAEFALFRLPPGMTQEQATISAVSTWALRDPSGVEQWLEGFPNTSSRAFLITNLMEAQPHLAVKLAAGISNQNIRNQESARAVRAWLAIDPFAARDWIATSTLPDAVKQQLLQTAK